MISHPVSLRQGCISETGCISVCGAARLMVAGAGAVPGGGKDLEEPLVVRPTSEAIVNHMLSQVPSAPCRHVSPPSLQEPPGWPLPTLSHPRYLLSINSPSDFSLPMLLLSRLAVLAQTASSSAPKSAPGDCLKQHLRRLPGLAAPGVDVPR